MRNQAMRDLAATQSFEAAETANQKTNYVAAHNNPDMNTRVPDTRRPTQMDTEGYVWVDPRGGFIAPVTAGRGEGEEPGASGSGRRADAAATTGRGSGRQGPQLNERQAEYAGMDSTQRSMYMWRRLNPGCMESTTRVPVSTFKDHFGEASRGGEAAAEPDKTHHLKKTDFSHYTEVKLRLMQHIKS